MKTTKVMAEVRLYGGGAWRFRVSQLAFDCIRQYAGKDYKLAPTGEHPPGAWLQEDFFDGVGHRIGFVTWFE